MESILCTALFSLLTVTYYRVLHVFHVSTYTSPVFLKMTVVGSVELGDGDWHIYIYIYIYIYILLRLCISFPGGSVIKESACNAGDPPECRRSEFNLWFGKIPWRRKWQRTPVFLRGKCDGERSLVGLQSMQLQESDTTCLWINV